MSEMSFEIAVMSRRSVRGFQNREVPQDVINKVFDLARWAPSNTNIQPWQTYVASGATRDALRGQMMAAVQNGSQPNHDHKEPRKPIRQVWKDRRRECAAVLYHAMDISWEDKQARSAASFRNFELFDAPHVAFLCIDEAFGLSQAWDVGMYAQTLMLAMTANGLASCAQGTMGHHPELVREAFDLGPEVKVLFGLSFGYEDTSMKVNSAHTERAALEDTVTFRR
jgi:nitroreductase